MLIHVPSQQPDGQLPKQHVIQTYKVKDNKQSTYETYTHKIDRKHKSLFSIPYNITLIIKTDKL
jgi:hypothetical protein